MRATSARPSTVAWWSSSVSSSGGRRSLIPGVSRGARDPACLADVLAPGAQPALENRPGLRGRDAGDTQRDRGAIGLRPAREPAAPRVQLLLERLQHRVAAGREGPEQGPAFGLGPACVAFVP